MSTPLLELEGTAEEIQERLTDFAGQRLHVTVRPVEAPAEVTPDLTDNLDHYIYGLPKI